MAVKVGAESVSREMTTPKQATDPAQCADLLQFLAEHLIVLHMHVALEQKGYREIESPELRWLYDIGMQKRWIYAVIRHNSFVSPAL